MAQSNYAPGVYNGNLSQGATLPTVANNDYDGIPEGVLNTRENQAAVTSSGFVQPGIPGGPTPGGGNWPGGNFLSP